MKSAAPFRQTVEPAGRPQHGVSRERFLRRAGLLKVLVHCVRGLLARQAVEGWHSGWGEYGGVDWQQVVVRGQRGQRGLSHTQRHRHGLTDVQRLVQRQPAQAVGVETGSRQERLRTHERRLVNIGGAWFGRRFAK